MTESSGFYASLEPFQDFARFAEFDAYTPVPDDWVVLAGDIKGSTSAIAAGRYKAVNMVGAAVITCVLNACKGTEVPFVFGGDGGAVAVPGALADGARAALQRLQAHAGAAFDLELRAAAVPVARIRAEGHDLSVRRLALNGRNNLAMFAGGGIDHVDTILKADAPDDPDVLRVREDDPPPDLEGLSCRWAPLTASRDLMIALMVQPVGSEDPGAVYAEIVSALRDRLGGDIRGHAPASDATLRMRFPPKGLGLELRALSLGWGKAKALAWLAMTSVLQKIAHVRGTKIGAYDAPSYTEELKAQTDFRKYDGCLRAVLDCTHEEVAALEAWLEAERAKGRLVYGLHADRQALMTCLVFNLEQSEHIHFVDAAGGGFAKAAIGFKAQLAALSRRSGNLRSGLFLFVSDLRSKSVAISEFLLRAASGAA
jgi:hypothetical protein